MLKPWTFVIASHAIVATAAIVLGTFNVFRMVRGDRIHKAVGRTWAGLMLFVSIGSFFVGSFGDALSIFLHGLAAWTIFSICAGIYFARCGNINAHKGFMLGTYFGLLGASIGVIAVPTRRVPSYFEAHPVAMTLVAIAIVAAAGFFIALVIRNPHTDHVKSIEHKL
ncbi:DUF2306 domain-containing protein [Candidatus Saccharibacteria bacterium]|nr:MAG: DUF2306 domain-containing protein [Candidatus Saccharibacteria bacterium]